MIGIEAARDLLYREAHALDTGDWDGWLALYAPDAVFWMPAWRDETRPTDDPDRELSLIYYPDRSGLEERVWRLRSGQSVASQPLARVVHLVTNVRVAGEDRIQASFCVHRYDVRAERTDHFFGRYEYRVAGGGDGLLIVRKTIYLLNDVIPTVLDIYSV